ncbi:Acireductone dioxygenase ARD family [Melampsora americana]|nr:Acireductone dioxygenase ARD family [Melampsora americana]
MRAYIFEESSEDQRAEHDSKVTITPDGLKELGVLHWHTEKLDEVDKLATERGYRNRDQIIVSKEAMGDIYLTKINSFFEEHLHEDEEIRWIIDGTGYFDVRDKSDEHWIRIQVSKGDLLVLPPGIYHRFTVDTKDYIKAMRLFKDEPKWVPYNRNNETEKNPYRQAYVDAFVTGNALPVPAIV